MTDTTEARAAVEAADHDVDQWAAAVTLRETELADIDDRSGVAALDAGPDQLGEISDAYGKALAEAKIARNALKAAEDRATSARRTHLRAVAAELRDAAARAAERAAEHKAITDELLAQLAEHEGVPFGPRIDGPTSDAKPGSPTFVQASRTRILERDAEALTKKADLLASAAASTSLTRQAYVNALAAAGTSTPESKAHASRRQAEIDWSNTIKDQVRAARAVWIERRAADMLARRDPEQFGYANEDESRRIADHSARQEFKGRHAQDGPHTGCHPDPIVVQQANALAALGVELDLPPHPEGRRFDLTDQLA